MLATQHPPLRCSITTASADLSTTLAQRVVLYFYLTDDTPGCTNEACQFNDAVSSFAAAGLR